MHTLPHRLVTTLALSLLVAGCGDDGKDKGDVTEGFGARLDETAISAEISGTSMAVTVPLSRVEGTSALSGKLTVELTKVGSDVVLYSGSAAFSLGPNGATPKAPLTAPSFEHFSELGGFVLRYRVSLPDGDLHGRRSLFMAAQRVGLVVMGNNRFPVGEKGALRILAVDTASGEGVEGVKVQVRFIPDSGTERTLDSGTTDKLGEMQASFSFTADEAGGGTIKVNAGSRTSSHSVLVERARQVLLTTDKPLYQPGQTVHIRALAMGQPGLTPTANEKLLIEVEDPQGNKLFKKETTSDSYGIGSLRFTLARLVGLGTYRARVTMGTTVREKTFEVARYTLPKFKVALSLDKPFHKPGESITGSLQADYFFNKHVKSADVQISAEAPAGQEYAQVLGKTDDTGYYAFTLTAPPGGVDSVLVTARVVDVASAEVTARATTRITSEQVVLQVVPDRATVAQGDSLVLFVMASDPTGKPLAGQVSLSNGLSGSAKLDASGLAAVTVSVMQCYGSAQVQFNGTGGETATVYAPVSCDYGSPSGRLRLSTDKALYTTGATATVKVQAPAGASMAQLDVLRGNATAAVLPVKLNASGAGSVQLPLQGELRRTLVLRAHALHGGQTISDRRMIYVQGADQLAVKVSTDKSTYRPAGQAKVTLQLTDMQGKPTPGALGVQVVDEALYALTEFKPGLERRFFFLEDAVLDAGGGLQFVSPDVLLKPEPSTSDQLRAKMLFAAAGQEATYPIHYRSGDDLPAAITASRAGFSQLAEKLEKDFEARFSAYWLGTPTSMEMGSWCKGWAAGRHDDWGQVLRMETSDYGATLTSAGMDETFDTSDDLSSHLYYASVLPDKGIALPGAHSDGGWSGSADAGAMADAGMAPPPSADGGGAGSASSPTIRQYFPETLYVNPALITDSQGKAEIDLSLADSITTWRLSTIAHSKAGQLGSAEAGITVFQEFFVDTLLPTHLLQNDEVQVPVAVYNYLSSPQTVTVTVKTEPWFDLLEGATKAVDVPAKSVASVTFRIKAKTVGTHPFTATGVTATESDGVKRTVEVKPDGIKQEVVFSGLLKPGTTSHTVSIPPAAIDGASELFVRVYPGILAEVVGGFESILSQPHGCFEQTSASTYPNAMVLQYLRTAGLSTPQLEEKAKGYLEEGYQRLLTYEVSGGGFSLWGDPPANLILSAFGLMELYDMSKVRYIDEALISRTQSWLLAKQVSDGSFAPLPNGFYENVGNMAQDTLRGTAYVAWSLAHSGYTGPQLDKAMGYVKQKVVSSDDTYTLAVAANALVAHLGATDPVASAVLAKLKAAAEDDGKVAHWTSGGVSMTYGYGKSMEIETTALVLGALLLAKDQSGLTGKGLAYLTANKSDLGGYGTTQATVLSLRALMLALEAQGGDKAQGTIQVSHGSVVQGTVNVTPATSDVTRLFDMKQAVVEGDNKVTIDFTGTGELAYQVVGIYYLPHGSVAGQGPLSFSVSYDKTEIVQNESIKVTAAVQNKGSGPIPTVLMQIGLPPGFTVDESQLTPAKTGGIVNNVEQTGPYLVLYLGNLATQQSVTFDMTGTLAGVFKAPASEAYPYYTPEYIQTVDTPVVTVTAPQL